jgi:ATP sulfurylase
LVPPHGGRLVQREAIAEPGACSATLVVGARELVDCTQLTHGSYSPLSGFMDQETLASVLRDYRLPDGTIWPLPILLQVAPESLQGVAEGDRIALADASGAIRGLLDVSQRFEIELADTAELWFATRDPSHPGVARLRAGGSSCVAGEVTLVDGSGVQSSPYELPPQQSRFIFMRKGWNRVVGFHTGALPLLAHETAQLAALESSHADGLLITAASGPRRPDDEAPGSVVLGSLPLFARDCPAREAVFSALCHKNLGCSHFAIARGCGFATDDAGLREVRDLFEKLGDLGIEPVEVDARGAEGDMRELVRDLLRADGGPRGV